MKNLSCGIIVAIESCLYMYQISLLFMKFILFSMMGYIAEMIECAIDEGRITNRGFLCGPILPVFGLGSMLLIFLLNPLKKNFWLVIFLGIFITTLLEYCVGLLLEKIFHNKWWDYSQEKFNLQGRICLKNSLLFGLGTALIIYIINPWLTDFLIQFKDEVLYISSLVIAILFLLDVFYSSMVAYKLRHRIIIVEDLKNQKLAKIPGMLEKMLMPKLKGMRKMPKRLLKAFPHYFKNYQKELELIQRVELKMKQKKEKEKRKKKKRK